jgi:hypothetical protein
LLQHYPIIGLGTYDGSCAAALVEQVPVIASKAMQSPEPGRLLRRCAPRNDVKLAVQRVMGELRAVVRFPHAYSEFAYSLM